jgi:hypothetical protein
MRERERELVCLRVYLCERVRRRGARGIVGREKRVTGKRVFLLEGEVQIEREGKRKKRERKGGRHREKV